MLTVLVLLQGCDGTTEDTTLLEELTENTPNLAIEEPQYTFIRNSARLVRLSAESAEFFTRSNKQYFTKVAFIEFDRDNNTLNSGSADTAIYFTNSGDFELTGNVIFQSLEQNATISAPYILWNNEEQKIFTKENDRVMVTRPAGTRIEGRNLMADLANRVIEFEDGSGVISPQDTFETEGVNVGRPPSVTSAVR